MGNYHDLSCMMGTYPGMAIFKRFKTANVRNVLILQAEITNLTHQLGTIILADRKSDKETHKELEKRVSELQNCDDDEEKAVQWLKIQEIRGLLKEYNVALLQLQSLFRLPPVKKTNLAALRGWLNSESEHGGKGFLKGFEKEMWDEEQDLTSLAEVNESKDVISKWIDGSFISWFYHKIGHRFKDHTLPVWDPTVPDGPKRTHLDFYPDSSAIVTTISTVFASTLPTLSIFALYYITSPVVRLGMITVFTSLFSLIIAVFANAKRSDCFAATAGFAAVLVVFVGSTDTSNCSCTAT